MLQYVHSVTLHGTNGRIWTKKPIVGANGLATVFCTASSKVAENIRPLEFSCVAFDQKAEYLAAVDTKGNVYVFNIPQNRYVRLDRAGYPGTAACFSTLNLRQLFVAFTVSYDTYSDVCCIASYMHPHGACMLCLNLMRAETRSTHTVHNSQQLHMAALISVCCITILNHIAQRWIL